MNRVVFPDKRGELNFSCREAGMSCAPRPGVMLPICCIENLVQIIGDVMAVVVVVVFYSSNKSTKTQANETFHYTILVN